MRAITIGRGNAPAVSGEPKRRGRPPKRKDDSETGKPEVVKAKEDGEQIFGPRSKKRSPVVPPSTDMEPVVPRDLGESFAEMAEESQHSMAEMAEENPTENPTPPTRATFAGRKKPSNDEAAATYDARRSKFYESVPTDLWKDPLERVFWNKCSALGDLDMAVTQFLTEQGRGEPSSSSRAKPQRKVKAKAKAKAKSKLKMKEPGRNRGRGRGKGGKR